MGNELQRMQGRNYNDRTQFNNYFQSEFDKYDRNHDGRIDQNEFMPMVNDMCNKINAEYGQYDPNIANKIRQAWQSIDKDGSGYITKDEFTTQAQRKLQQILNSSGYGGQQGQWGPQGQQGQWGGQGQWGPQGQGQWGPQGQQGQWGQPGMQGQGQWGPQGQQGQWGGQGQQGQWGPQGQQGQWGQPGMQGQGQWGGQQGQWK